MTRLRKIASIAGIAAAALTTALAARFGTSAVRDESSRAATFITVLRGETLFVERVRDVPGGYDGEVAMPNGAVWFRYRVRLGPGETVARYELDMTSMVGASPGDVPRPLLKARREADSVIIEPQAGMGIPGARLAVPSSALLGSFEVASLEQAVRYGLGLGSKRSRFKTISPWNGQAWEATVTRTGRNRVRLEMDPDTWQFTLDAQRRIVRGERVRGHPDRGIDPFWGMRVIRLDPARDHPLHRPISIGGKRRDRLDSLVHAWGQREAAFRATLENARSVSELAAALDSHIVAFADRGGVYQAERSLEASAMMGKRPDGRLLAERYARRAVACADSHQVIWFGEQGMIAARMAARLALAEILSGLGRRDSAARLLEEAMALPPESEHIPLQRDVRVVLAGVLAADGRPDQAIAALFEAAALDTTSTQVAESVERPLRDLWTHRFGGDTTLAARIAMARHRKWPSELLGGGHRELKETPAPAWTGVDLRGARHSSRSHAGRPVAVVFWGGWSEPNRKVLRMAEDWHRRRAVTGVDVVTFNWELPGPGPISEQLVGHTVQSQSLTLPVLLDHDRAAFQRFGGEAYPQVFMIDRRGRMVRTDFGWFGANDRLNASVEALGRDELRSLPAPFIGPPGPLSK